MIIIDILHPHLKNLNGKLWIVLIASLFTKATYIGCDLPFWIVSFKGLIFLTFLVPTAAVSSQGASANWVKLIWLHLVEFIVVLYCSPKLLHILGYSGSLNPLRLHLPLNIPVWAPTPPPISSLDTVHSWPGAGLPRDLLYQHRAVSEWLQETWVCSFKSNEVHRGDRMTHDMKSFFQLAFWQMH